MAAHCYSAATFQSAYHNIQSPLFRQAVTFEESRVYTSPSLRRVILVVADGMRPDSIETFDLQCIQRLMQQGGFTLSATTVTPSVTAAAMTSLLTGVAPERHGIESDRFFLPRPRHDVRPLPKVLAEAGIPTTAFMRGIPRPFHLLAKRLTHRLGITYATFAGQGAKEILAAFDGCEPSPDRGLTIMHWPDLDQAGHQSGWMSDEYGDAARTVDQAVGALAASTDIANDGETLLILMADHGGGGLHANRHDSAHPLDRTIPIVLAGGAVSATELRPRSSILDVPATILWAIGVPDPDSYAGRPYFEAFERTPQLATV